jgi:GNAT superfamily N-acetyltransferase
MPRAGVVSVAAGDRSGTLIRPLLEAETPLLTAATVMNVNWAGDQLVTATDVAAEADLAHYTVLDRGRGDEALVACDHSGVVGVVWYLFLGAADPGYGYVADDVPELCVCVWPGHRGAGLGERLVRAACVTAAERGVARMSLSVEAGNPARRLYERLGFADVPGAAEGTMVCTLTRD